MANKLSYEDAGVSIDTGNELAQKYLSLMHRTFTPNVQRFDNGFGGLYSLKGLLPTLTAGGDDEPMLVSGTDGVGTKLKLAFQMNVHNTVGIDLVAMSVNDVLVQGARPLFFLDYIGTGKCDKQTMLGIVEGVSTGCLRAGCALLGGETAEMPGFYPPGEYDLAGFAVGIVARGDMLDGKRVRPGDAIVGLASTGLHSNGFSLARKALLEVGGLKLDQKLPELDGQTLGETMLTPTRIYVKTLLAALERHAAEKSIHALVHVTGGGLIENTPRVLPDGCGAEFDRGAWEVPPIFKLVQRCGNVDAAEMDRVFNMGLGMLVICDAAQADALCAELNAAGEKAARVGRIVAGENKVAIR